MFLDPTSTVIEGLVVEVVPHRTKSNPEQIPILRPAHLVPHAPPDSAQLDMSVMHSQDQALEPQSTDLALAKARASSALGGAALNGLLEHILRGEQEQYSEEEEEVEVEEEEKGPEQKAAPHGAPALPEEQPELESTASVDAASSEGPLESEAAASGAEPSRPPVNLTPGPGAFIHWHLTSPEHRILI